MKWSERAPRQRSLFLAGLLLPLLAFAGLIGRNEGLLHQGRVVVLALAPVDPRSLMQGDYMALDYEVAQQLGDQLRQEEDAVREAARQKNPDAVLPEIEHPEQSRMVLKADPGGVARLQRLEDGRPLRAGEFYLSFKWRTRWSWDRPALPSEAWFFQEGEGERFAKARFAVLRVGEDGRSLLAGLQDEQHKPILP